MKECPKGFHHSTSDKKRRCVRTKSRAICAKMGKEYSADTNRCRTPCKRNETRGPRGKYRKGPGTVCRRNCVRGFRRETLADGRVTKCKKAK